MCAYQEWVGGRRSARNCVIVLERRKGYKVKNHSTRRGWMIQGVGGKEGEEERKRVPVQTITIDYRYRIHSRLLPTTWIWGEPEKKY